MSFVVLARVLVCHTARFATALMTVMMGLTKVVIAMQLATKLNAKHNVSQHQGEQFVNVNLDTNTTRK